MLLCNLRHVKNLPGRKIDVVNCQFLFALRRALNLYDFYQARIAECDLRIELALRGWEQKIDPAAKPLSGKAVRKRPKA